MRYLYLQCQRNASDASPRGRRRYHHSEWPSASSLSRRRSVTNSGFARISTETAPARSTGLLRCGIDAASHHRHRIETPDAVGCIASTATMRYDDDVGSPEKGNCQIGTEQDSKIHVAMTAGDQPHYS